MLHCINHRRLWLLCLLSLFFILTAEATEYIVSPAPGDEFGVSRAGEEVTVARDFTVYWQFLLWLALMNVLSVIDILLFPVKFLLVILGFRVKDHSNAAGVMRRRHMFSFIKANPGNCVSEIADCLGMSRGALRYHLKVLESEKLIEAYSDQGKVRYFQNNSTYGENEKLVISVLQNEMTRIIISNILYKKCNTNGDLARKIGVSKGTISWYANQLKESGLIEENKVGRSTTYSINPVYRDSIKKTYVKFLEYGSN